MPSPESNWLLLGPSVSRVEAFRVVHFFIGKSSAPLRDSGRGRSRELSVAQRTDVWRRWKAGESLHTIGRAFDRPHTSMHCLLSHHGGIVPAVRRRSVLALTVVEREDISRGLASGSSIRDIAKDLERAASTVSREVARHGGRPDYRAQDADQRAWNSALRPKRCLLAIHVKLRNVVASRLILDWSPEQISGWLKIRYPDDESMRVSHAPGSEEQTKTPIACYDNTCRRAPTFPTTRNPNWTRSRCV
jgi:hypothetical protein